MPKDVLLCSQNPLPYYLLTLYSTCYFGGLGGGESIYRWWKKGSEDKAGILLAIMYHTFLEVL